MGEWWNYVPTSGWQRFAIDAAWQSTLVCVLALSLVRLVRLRPTTRAAVLLAATILCVVAPVSSYAARSSGWGMFAPAIEATERGNEDLGIVLKAPAGTPQVVLHNAAIGRPAEIPQPKIEWPATGWRVLAVLWPLASLGLAWRLLRSARALQRACWQASPCEDEEIRAALHQASRTLGVDAPELLVSSAVDSPALVLWGRPRLLLPALKEPRNDWLAIFYHELAHLARRDGRSRLAVEAVAIMLPWQSLLWFVRRDFRAACEEACDDWAIAAGADPVEFASLLLDFVPQARPSLALGMAESVSAARARIMRLLAMQGTPRPRLGKFLGLAGWVVAGALAVVLALLQSGRLPWQGADEPPWGNTPVSLAAAEARSPSERQSLGPYRVEAPDVLLIDAVKIVPKPPYKIEPLDTLEIFVINTVPDQNIAGPYPVEADGTIMLGPAYGGVKVSGLSISEARDTIKEHLEQIIQAPEVSVSLAESAGQQQIEGEHLIGPDGTVNLGTYGSVFVAGMTLVEVRKTIEAHLLTYLDNPKVSVDVFKYNSKFFYIVWEHDGTDHIQRVPYSGNETVLDAIAQISKDMRLTPNTRIWIARPASADGQKAAYVLPVDWRELYRGESNRTNFWLEPGDRVFVLEN
ncbi:MAG TPA: polysaccharide biosynthesis/export family protein [Pirellulales bacterium]|nr:polysaccharide biosynthesis/export family protein [Pirellulales bacterium]